MRPQPRPPSTAKARSASGLQLGLLGRRETAGTQVTGVIAEILGLVVVELGGRHDADHRQRLPASTGTVYSPPPM